MLGCQYSMDKHYNVFTEKNETGQLVSEKGRDIRRRLPNKTSPTSRFRGLNEASIASLLGNLRVS